MEQNYINVICRKIYNGIYKSFLFIFSTGIIKIIFFKNQIVEPLKNYKKNFFQNFIIEHPVLEDQIKIKKNLSYIEVGTFDAKGQIITNLSLNLNNETFIKTNCPRKKFLVSLVLLEDGSLGVKKRHSSYKVFFRELYAMSTLPRKISINIPKIYDYSIKHKYLIMEYVDGRTIRNLAESEESIFQIKELANSEEFISGNLATRVKLITQIEKPYIHSFISSKMIIKIMTDYKNMLKSRFVYQDIRYPNFVVHKEKLYWLDFEHCYFHPIAPKYIFESISNQYINKLKKFFDV